MDLRRGSYVTIKQIPYRTRAERFSWLTPDEHEPPVAPNFRHHNVWFPGNADAFKKGMADNLRQNPEKKLEIKQSIEEGDRVMVMSHVTFKPGVQRSRGSVPEPLNLGTDVITGERRPATR